MLVCLSLMNTNKFEFWKEGREEGVRGGAEEKEEEEQKVKIDLKFSTKFQNNLSTNSWEKHFETFRAMRGRIDRWKDWRMNKISYRAACMVLKMINFEHKYKDFKYSKRNVLGLAWQQPLAVPPCHWGLVPKGWSLWIIDKATHGTWRCQHITTKFTKDATL
jgi:hypothetical protein